MASKPSKRSAKAVLTTRINVTKGLVIGDGQHLTADP